MINLWLDATAPPPPGWVWVKRTTHAKVCLEGGIVERMSLDAVLGYELVNWCARTKHWSMQRPECHCKSANMVAAITWHWS